MNPTNEFIHSEKMEKMVEYQPTQNVRHGGHLETPNVKFTQIYLI